MAAFAATNLDDLFLLVAWFAAGRYRARDIVLGQYLGIGALVVASIVASLAALLVPGDWLRWLGLLPAGLGILQILRPADEPDASPAEAAGIAAVAAVTIANGADNLGVYIPLFATSSAPAVGVTAAVFAVMTAAWCGAARWLVRHPAAGAPLRRYAPKAVPWVLVGIGLWILVRPA